MFLEATQMRELRAKTSDELTEEFQNQQARVSHTATAAVPFIYPFKGRKDVQYQHYATEPLVHRPV